MYIVDDVLISEDIFEQHFQCNLNACKGACCVDGDFGAPLDTAEIDIIKQIYPQVKPYLDASGIEAIEKDGPTQRFRDDDHSFMGTRLRSDGACAFLTPVKDGIAYCGIESAYRNGDIHFKKPISCELYPIRYGEIVEKNYRVLNYDRWEICNPACSQGSANGIRLYQFLKDALVRKFGENFYSELEVAADHFHQTKEK
jgi:hypothetical protein